MQSIGNQEMILCHILNVLPETNLDTILTLNLHMKLHISTWNSVIYSCSYYNIISLFQEKMT